jgi:predicted outer membrane protein
MAAANETKTPPLSMKMTICAFVLLLGTAALGILGLTGCASQSDDTPATADFFGDPDTRRLKLQEEMTKMTRGESNF